MTPDSHVDADRAEFIHASFAQAVNMALAEAMRDDPRVFLLGEDIQDPGGGVMYTTKGLSSEFGSERVRATPISEAAIVGAAVGASLAGYRPVAEIMLMDFLPIAADQLINHAAKVRYTTAGTLTAPLTIRTVSSQGIQTGATHSQSLEAWLLHTPGIKVAIASNPADAKGLLTSCIFDDDPCVFIEPMMLLPKKGPVPTGHHRVPLGSASVVRSGADVTLIGYGLSVQQCLAAADQLASTGVSCEVVDLRSIVPLDLETVRLSVRKTGAAVIVHTSTELGGVGAELAASLAVLEPSALRAPVRRVGARPCPAPSAKHLEEAFYPSVMRIIEAVDRIAELSRR